VLAAVPLLIDLRPWCRYVGGLLGYDRSEGSRQGLFMASSDERAKAELVDGWIN
jgi:hypothetical protein